MHHYKWSISELEDMMPFEREMYIMLLRQWIEEEHQRRKEEEMRRKGR